MQTYRPPHQQRPEETRNLMIAIALSLVLLGGWQYFYEYPRRQQEAAAQLAQAQKKEAATPTAATATGAVPMQANAHSAPLTRADALAQGKRIPIVSPELKGSISVTGARLDDLTLIGYKETLDPASPDVTLLAPSVTQAGYFADFGWASTDTSVPDSNTVWEKSADEMLGPKGIVTFHWKNAQGVLFGLSYALDEHYMFTVIQTVTNDSDKPMTFAPYGLINRELDQEAKQFKILHEGPLGVAGGALQEIAYKDLRESGPQNFETQAGWVGITDKYWLTALIPVTEASGQRAETGFTERFRHFGDGAAQRYQADYTAKPITVAPGTSASMTTRVFAGPKRVTLLEDYEKTLNIPLFDRAVDFGRLYFLTKPIFHLLHYFHGLVGNFGLAILLLTVCIKALMFPLAYKSYGSMAQMKRLNPKMAELKERHADDRLKLNQEIIALYKNEKVNPASGCLPMLIQVPVFFSLYKVLFVTIEMRHAPFFGWIHDLSAPDPTNLFTLFGLIPWSAEIFGFHLHVGIWPMIMAGTMFLQQKINPKPTDPAQAQIMGLLPWFFLFLFASFPAGLVIYWAWSNTITIIQQTIIMRRHEGRRLTAKA